jgi:penicillin amidase
LKRLKRILAVLAVLLFLVFMAGFFFVQHLKPEYEGERPLPELKDSVTVYFDSYGIPHIYADNEADAFKALGYVHAQDRLWQMELLRRIAPGRLSEVFGPDALENDKLFLGLGIDEATRDVLAKTDPEAPALQLAQAYLDGINQYIREGSTPIEFYFTGIDKTPFTLEDVYNTVGYMAFSFAMAHKTDPFLTEVRDRLGLEYVAELLGNSPSNTTMIRTYDSRFPADSSHRLTAEIRELLRKTPVPALEGSNSWVLGPNKTKSGKVILANDPHIGFAQPSVWYEAHIVTPAYEKYGYYLAGVPYPLLGHDRNIAYGLTMFENDDIDFYVETTDLQDSSRYLRPGGWGAFGEIEKQIPVKDAEPVTFRYRKTDRGPVLNDALKSIKETRPVSMSWVYTQGENEVLEALYGISHSRDIGDFEKAIEKIHAPGLNVMYGDAQGNVAWWGAARISLHPDSLSTKLFLDGATVVPPDPVPFEKNPRAINPPWGYVYSANNQADTIQYGDIPGYYLPENRARRIEELLEPRNDWDLEGAMEMITDVTSPVNPEIVKDLAAEIPEADLGGEAKTMLEALKRWDGTADLNSKESVLFHRWVYEFLRGTFRDELGADGFESLLSTHLVKRLISPMAKRVESVWWDDIRTPGEVEDRQRIVREAFQRAVASIQSDFGGYEGEWGWKDVHTVEFNHPFGRVESLRSYFNVGPFPVNGTREVINNLMFPYDSTGYYKVSAGPSTRRIIDFSNIGESMSILPTGQSGNPFSPHYSDQAEMYLQGKFRKMLLEKGEIEATAKSVLIFHPGE